MTTLRNSQRLALPPEGRDWESLRAELQDAKKDDFDWQAGRVPLYIYYVDPEHQRVMTEAYAMFITENAMGPRAFPSVKRMETEVIDMALSLLHAPEGAGASFTSGGSESIFLALKTARDRARRERPTVTQPNLVVPRTLHGAFDKAAHSLGLRVIRTRPGPDSRADVQAISDAIDDDTIMIVGSAPNYPFGVFDPIEQLGELAASRGLWFHVDCCVGGFLAPFARMEGWPIPRFDFEIPGVTTISADLHKYGYTAKGASLLLYRDASRKADQMYSFGDWPRGMYITETAQGTRAGGAVASAWAVMNYLGEAGYRRLARTVMETCDQYAAGIAAIPGLEVITPRELCIFVYRSVDPALDINAVGDGMLARGWFVGRSAEPVGIHFAVNPVHAPAVSAYLHDLRAVVGELRGSGKVGAADQRTY